MHSVLSCHYGRGRGPHVVDSTATLGPRQLRRHKSWTSRQRQCQSYHRRRVVVVNGSSSSTTWRHHWVVLVVRTSSLLMLSQHRRCRNDLLLDAVGRRINAYYLCAWMYQTHITQTRKDLYFGETGQHAITVFTFPDPCHSFAVWIRLNTDPNLTPNPIRTHDRAPNPNRQNYDLGLETWTRLGRVDRFHPIFLPQKQKLRLSLVYHLRNDSLKVFQIFPICTLYFSIFFVWISYITFKFTHPNRHIFGRKSTNKTTISEGAISGCYNLHIARWTHFLYTQFPRHRRTLTAAIRHTNLTHITSKPDALDTDAPDAFYQQPALAVGRIHCKSKN